MKSSIKYTLCKILKLVIPINNCTYKYHFALQLSKDLSISSCTWTYNSAEDYTFGLNLNYNSFKVYSPF